LLNFLFTEFPLREAPSQWLLGFSGISEVGSLAVLSFDRAISELTVVVVAHVRGLNDYGVR